MPDALDTVTLRGEVVQLDPLSQEHAPALAAIAREEWFATWNFRSLSPHTPELARAYVEEALDGWRRGVYLPFVVCLRESGEFVGATRFGDVDLEAGHVEIGWTWYVEQVRGTAVNPECKLLLLSHAFDTLGVERVALRTGSANLRSQRAIAAPGAVREGTLRRVTRQRNGAWRDTVWYSILREEWPAARSRLEQRLSALL